jgi:zinc transport system substrate-binding protein
MRFCFLLIVLIIPLLVSAGDNLSVLATNSWTAAYARAAGIKHVDQLAPSSLLHPSEYELQITDLEKIKNADLVIYAGYEVVISQIKQSTKMDEKKFVKIETGYSEEQMAKAIMEIAVIAGTESSAKVSVERIRKLFTEQKDLIDHAGLKGKPVITHFFQRDFAKEIGLNVVGVFGPAPMELYELGELAKKNAVLLIDNAHNPISQPLAEMKKGVKVVELLNFPGIQNTSSIEDVIRLNVKKILDSK